MNTKKLAKRQMLMEGALKQFFEMFFDEGQNRRRNSFLLELYAQKELSVPETFVKKARSQYENLTKVKNGIRNE